MSDIFNALLINPIINALVAIYKLLLILGVPFALGFSVILLTVLIKFIIYPLTGAQIRSTQKMQELKPHLDRIKEKHKNDKSRQQQETVQLYRQFGINPAAGCLPLLIQLPIFIALYNVFFKVIKEDTIATMSEINQILYLPALHLGKPWDANFFGISLAATPSGFWQVNPILLSIPLITVFLQFVQSKMMTPSLKKTTTNEHKDDFQKIMQTQMVYFLPLMIGFFSFSFPVGLSLYWNTFTVFGIIQQHLLNKKNVKTTTN